MRNRISRNTHSTAYLGKARLEILLEFLLPRELLLRLLLLLCEPLPTRREMHTSKTEVMHTSGSGREQAARTSLPRRAARTHPQVLELSEQLTRLDVDRLLVLRRQCKA